MVCMASVAVCRDCGPLSEPFYINHEHNHRAHRLDLSDFETVDPFFEQRLRIVLVGKGNDWAHTL